MQDFFELVLAENQKMEIARVLDGNAKTERFGLALSQEDAAELMAARHDSLKRYHRVEFGEGILPKLQFAFCDSQYVEQEHYRETLERLQDIFYQFKSEMMEKMTDDELITYMRNQFEGSCSGSLDRLETALHRLAGAVRGGYVMKARKGVKDEYDLRERTDEFEELSEEEGWSRELYWDALNDLMD
ncbi:MAG: hypothetical protein KHZ58_06430 [Hungatella hathewayi]|nr:hypothetical protein [Hungatella hathewayi]